MFKLTTKKAYWLGLVPALLILGAFLKFAFAVAAFNSAAALSISRSTSATRARTPCASASIIVSSQATARGGSPMPIAATR